MNLILLVIGVLYLFYITWVFYLAIMNLRRNKARLSKTVLRLSYPIVIAGSLLNITFNFIVGTVVFYEPPREWFFTDRCQRHQERSKGTRLRRANWFCANILDPFDLNGKHC